MTEHRRTGAFQSRARLLARPAWSTLWNVERHGFDLLPSSGPAILCPNHRSFFDSTVMAMTASRTINFIGKAEYMNSWRTKHVFPAMGMIPIDRSGGAKSAEALDAARAVLERGELLCIYPEGTRTRDGELSRGRTGAARLATAVGCPIYPVGIAGTEKIQPIGASFPAPGRSCSVTIGSPVLPDRFTRCDTEYAGWRAMTDEVMAGIAELCGQRYLHADEPAASVVTDDANDRKLITVG